MFFILFTVKKRKEGNMREGDYFETEKRAGKLIHENQSRKWSHNLGKIKEEKL
jgi:hypothetical protein